MGTTKNTPKKTEASPKFKSSLLKFLGFILLVGSISLVTFQSAILAVSS